MQPQVKFRPSLSSPLKPIICVLGTVVAGEASRLEGASEPGVLFIHLLFLPRWVLVAPCELSLVAANEATLWLWCMDISLQ